MKITRRSFIWIAIFTIIVAALLYGGRYYSSNHGSKTSESAAVATTTVTAYINSIEGNKITLDYFDALSGEKAVEAKITDGRCTREEANNNDCLPDGVYDRNINSKLRTFTLPPDVKITTATAFEKTPTGITTISIQELKKDYVDKRTIDGERLYYPYEITLNPKGEVVVIKEIYRP